MSLAFTASASAAPPLKRLVWAKAVAAYTAQARAHGAKAECTPWSPSGTTTMECDFGDRGRVLFFWRPEPCVYHLNVMSPRPGMPANFRRTVDAEVNYCQKRWWTKPLPAPWTPSR